MEESTVTDTVVNTLASLTEEELVSTEIRRFDPCRECVASFSLNNWSYVDRSSRSPSWKSAAVAGLGPLGAPPSTPRVV